MNSLSIKRPEKILLIARILTYLMFSGASLGVSAIAVPVLTRLMSPEQYGIAALVISYTVILVPLMAVGTETYFPAMKAQLKKDDYRRVAGAGGSLILIIALILSIAALAAVEAAHLNWIYLLALPISFFQALRKTGMAVLAYEEKAKTYGFLGLSQAALAVLLSIVLIYFINDSAKYRLVGIFASELLIASIFVGRTLPFGAISRDDFISLLKYAFPLVVAAFPAWLINEYGKIVLSRKENLAALGVYALSFQLGYIYIQFNRAISNAVIGEVYSDIDRAMRLRENLILNGTQLLVAVIFISIIAFAENLLLGENFRGHIQIIIIIMSGFVFQSFALLFNLYCAYHSLTGVRLKALFAGACFNGIWLWLYPDVDMLGVAYGFSISMAIYFFFMLFLLIKRKESAQ